VISLRMSNIEVHWLISAQALRKLLRKFSSLFILFRVYHPSLFLVFQIFNKMKLKLKQFQSLTFCIQFNRLYVRYIIGLWRVFDDANQDHMFSILDYLYTSGS